MGVNEEFDLLLCAIRVNAKGQKRVMAAISREKEKQTESVTVVLDRRILIRFHSNKNTSKNMSYKCMKMEKKIIHTVYKYQATRKPCNRLLTCPGGTHILAQGHLVLDPTSL